MLLNLHTLVDGRVDYLVEVIWAFNIANKRIFVRNAIIQDKTKKVNRQTEQLKEIRSRESFSKRAVSFCG